MKNIRLNIFAGLAALMALASCTSENGAGDAVIGFGEAEYTFSEDQSGTNGYVRLPLTITGEPKSYPITFSVEAVMISDGTKADEGETTENSLDNLVIFTQTEGLKYNGDPKSPACIEMYIVNDTELNGTRKFALTIKDVKGAEVGNASTIINIEDDDNPAYLNLVGDWTFTAYELTTGKEASFDVTITEGFTDAEIAANREECRLLCWGFAGEKGVYPNANRQHQAEWYLKCYKTSNDINIMIGNVMTTEAKFEVGTPYLHYATIAVSQIPVGTGELSFDSESLGISGLWYEDYNKITFTPNAGFGAIIAGNNTGTDYSITGYFMGDIYYNIVMTRK